MGNNSSIPIVPIPTTLIKSEVGTTKTFSIPGAPTSYIQTDVDGLKKCLQNVNDPNIINSCISQNIFAPSTYGALSGVNLWTGPQLPNNPACNFTVRNNIQSGSDNILNSASAINSQQIPKNGILNKQLIGSNTSIQNFNNLENYQMIGLYSQNNITLIIIIIITILIVIMK